MGLDLVEFVMATEEAFGVAIQDAEAAQLETPGQLAEYLEARLARGPSPCLEQRAFYVLRRAGRQVLGCERGQFHPETAWASLLPRTGARAAWRQIGAAMNASQWPGLWPWRLAPMGEPTVGHTARRLATFSPSRLLAEDEGWSRAKIEAVLSRLIWEQLGIENFSWDDRFTVELRID